MKMTDSKPAHATCTHQSSTWPNTSWLPLTTGIIHHGLANHPYCIHCGTVKNISSDRGKGLGYYTSALGRVKELKSIQVRLISKELRAYSGFDDTYAMTGTDQKKIFIKTVRKYANIPEHTIIKYL